MLDSYQQPRWVRRVIDDVVSSPRAEIVLIVRNGQAAPERVGLARRIWRRRQYLLYGAYTRLDRRVHTVEPDAFEFVEVADLVPEVDEIVVHPVMTRHTDAFRPDDVEAVRARDLDVLLRFGFRILKGDVLGAARYGIWSFHHDDPDVIRGGPPGFWEVMRGEPTTGSVLQVLTEDLDNGHVLYRSWSPTVSSFSVTRNNNNNFWKSTTFVRRALDALPAEPPARERTGFSPYSRRLYTIPKDREMAALLGRLARRLAGRTLEKALTYEQWAVAYRFRSSPQDPNDTFYRFERVMPPSDRFWADPFPIVVDGRYYVFVEEFLFDRGKGHISVMEVGRDGVVSLPKPVLELDHHLSYPFLLDWEGHLYLLPEGGSTDVVQLHRCVSFPDRWAPGEVLLEAPNPQDATLVEHDGRWWMFVTLGSPGADTNWDELHVYHADTPLGPWSAHARNPVRSDVRSSRPAGGFFRRGDALFRPAQDCSRRYGYGTSIQRVTRLTTDEYAEEHVARIAPEWLPHAIGVHTLNSADDLTVIDYLARRPRPFRRGRP
jgi:hypothetical protein